jgi:disulfide oxidoreductase YuzD
MTATAVIQIVGAPVACATGVQETWRELAQWIGGQIEGRYGPAVSVTYYDLFEPDCPPLPEGAQLPLVFVNDDVLSSGGKLSMPAIRKRLEALGVMARGQQ